MSTTSVLDTIAGSLDQLEQAVRAPAALTIPAESAGNVLGAIKRARAKLLSPGEAVIVVALAGGTGAGKSSLVNALAGAPIAQVSRKRPTTSKATVYLHEQVDRAILPPQIAADASFVAHERMELRHLVLVDTPDLDSFRTQHRSYTAALLQRADLVLYVFSSQNYEDERVWSILEAEKRYSRTAAVLNKVDLLEPGEAEQVADDLKASLARVGLADAPLFCTVARGASDEADSPPEGTINPTNELPRLADWLFNEWRVAEIEAMRARQCEAVLTHLRDEVGKLLPADPDVRLARIRSAVEAQEDTWGRGICDTLGARWATIRRAMWPLVTMALHDRIEGPLRGYFGVVDFVRFGIPLALARIAGKSNDTLEDVLRNQLDPTPSGLADLVMQAESQVGQWLFDERLPIAAWQKLVHANGRAAGEQLAEALANGLEADWLAGEPRKIDRYFSIAGGAIPAVIVLLVGILITEDMLDFDNFFWGWQIVVQGLAMCVFWWIALHVVIAATLQGRRQLTLSLEPAAARIAGAWLIRRMITRLDHYADELRGDRERFTAPLERIGAVLGQIKRLAIPKQDSGR